MKKRILLPFLKVLFFSYLAFAQNIAIEGYVFEDNNRGFLNEADVRIFEEATENFVIQTTTNIDGLFKAELPVGKDYIVKINKDLFFEKQEIISTKGKKSDEKVFAKIKLKRKPGYIFDVTLAEKGDPTATVDAITGAKIEVFNNTKMEETLVIESLEGINFDVTFERGNHYTVLIRKKGYFKKRLEAYVDVEGCILCFEGVGTVTPGLSDVMSEGNLMGSVLANIELEPATLNRTIEIENIYYDLNKYYIRDDAAVELDKVVKLLNDNPSIIIELGSHTDARGGNSHNQRLSANRAKAAVEYIVDKGGINKNRISFKGYGEEKLVNHCKDGVKCSEKEHQKNRRTELKIVGFKEVDPLIENRSLSEMITEEKLLNEVLNSEQIQVKPGEEPDFEKLNKASKKQEKTTETSEKTEKTTTTAKKSKKPKKSVTTSEKPVSASSKTKEATTAVENTPKNNQSLIISSGQGAETLVQKSDSAKQKMETKIPEFTSDKVLLIQNGKTELIEKMIGNQLNTRITDKLLSRKIYLETEKGIKTFQFDSIDKMPIDLLNVFLSKLAMVRQSDGWQLFPLKKDGVLPENLLKSLR